MNTASICLSDSRVNFRPGEELVGSAAWDLQRAPSKVEVRLCWFTDGVSVREAEIVDCRVFNRPAASDTQEFRFRLPTGPYSFRGRIAALEWALELVISPGGPSDRIIFSLSPTGEPVLLGAQEAVRPSPLTMEDLPIR